jgi:5-(carboxyamino)imidazole ribonucleotide synthase
MTIEEARKYPSYFAVLSPDFPSPAADLADEVVIGDLSDPEAVLDLAGRVDVVSYEIEHVSVAALRELESRGVPVLPGSAVLERIQDKGLQKRLWDEAGLPQAPWIDLPDDLASLPPADRAEILASRAAKVGGFPVVQKLRRGGYDGRGVRVLSGPGDGPLAGPSFLEAKVDFVKELAVVAVRAPGSAPAAYPCVEMVFDPAANLCDSVRAPADEPPEIRKSALRTALACVEALDRAAHADYPGGAGAVGVFAVELFRTRDGRVLVNEAAPRPHNSGHFTQDACAASQFEQYFRILAGLPTASTEQFKPARMLNILGAPGASGTPEYEGLAEALAVPGVTVHLYGKREVRPYRKMGHLTAVADTPEEANRRAEAARSRLRVLGS